jgi:hypothetical protein
MSVMSRTVIPATLRRVTSTSLSPAEGGAVQDADTGATAPATGVGLGKGAPDEVGVDAAEADAVAWGDGVRVECAVELLPQPARTTRATSASPGWSLVTRPRILTRRGRFSAAAAMRLVLASRLAEAEVRRLDLM